jgi:hypothetical protein
MRDRIVSYIALLAEAAFRAPSEGGGAAVLRVPGRSPELNTSIFFIPREHTKLELDRYLC